MSDQKEASAVFVISSDSEGSAGDPFSSCWSNWPHPAQSAVNWFCSGPSRTSVGSDQQVGPTLDQR